MAVKASAHITLHSVVDIEATYRYYLLQSSTLSKPSKPITNPPGSSWDDAEPTYTSGSTNSLYYVDLTVFSNGTFNYSEVSLSTSYEAAKEAYNKAQNAQDSVDNLAIGGRNYIRNSRTMEGWILSNATLMQDDDGFTICDFDIPSATAYSYTIASKPFIQYSTVRDKLVTFSLMVRSDNWSYNSGDKVNVSMFLSDDGETRRWYRDMTIATTEVSSEWTRVSITVTLSDDFFTMGVSTNTDFVIDDDTTFGIRIYNISTDHLQVKQIKLEEGNRATDWTPAPEDIDDTISDTEDSLREDIDNNAANINSARAIIDSINANISMLVTDKNGQSLMTQDGTSWTFNISSIQDTLDKAASNVDSLTNDFSDLSQTVDALNSAVDDLGEYTDYIRFGIDNGKPCIILGETDSNFRVLITNTDIRFMEGNSIPASISNQSLNIEKAVISTELKQGGFVWMARANGNYGLLWKGVE